MSRQALVSFYIYRQREREEKEELSRVIRDCFHPRHKDRSQPGCFTMTASVSTVPCVLLLMDPISYNAICNVMGMEELLAKLLGAVKE